MFDDLKPFENWIGEKQPVWWIAYNNVKHDRFRYIAEATLKNTYEAFAGLFLFMIIHIDNRSILYDYDLIRSTSYTQIKNVLSQKEPLDYGHHIDWGTVITIKTRISAIFLKRKDQIICLLSQLYLNCIFRGIHYIIHVLDDLMLNSISDLYWHKGHQVRSV